MSDTRTDDWHEPIDWYNAFQAGVTEFHPGPEALEVRHMFYIVAYDICEPSRLRRVARICEDYGIRIEKSVFQCDLPEEQFQNLWCELIDVIDDEEDAVVAYRICQSCIREAESMGVVPTFEKRVCYML